MTSYLPSLLCLFLVAAFVPAAAQESSADEGKIRLRVVQRSRLATIENQFRPELDSRDRSLELQTSLFVDAGRGAVKFHGEVMDVRTELNDAASFLNNTLVNTLEPLQSYVAWDFAGFIQPNSASTLKAGRFTMDLGRRRLIARSGFRNSISSFTGLDWQWRGSDGRNARAFYVVPMRILPTARDALFDNEQTLDRGNRDTRFAGGYYQLPAHAGGRRSELFWLDLDQPNRAQNDGARDFTTIGFRLFRPSTPGNWSYEFETHLQSGRSSATAANVVRRDLDHTAYFQHLEIGYGFEGAWKPTVLLQYDYGSGDRDPFDADNELFDPLYGERRFDFAPQGIYVAFARGNLETPGVRLTFSPAARWQTMLSYRSYKLAAERDAWSGVGLRDLSGQAGDSISRQLEGTLIWDAIPDRLRVEFGFAHMWMGRFPKQVLGPAFRGDPSYLYTTLTTSF
jgi:hypothetical protein